MDDKKESLVFGKTEEGIMDKSTEEIPQGSTNENVRGVMISSLNSCPGNACCEENVSSLQRESHLLG
jgi:hypothetical protein